MSWIDGILTVGVKRRVTCPGQTSIGSLAMHWTQLLSKDWRLLTVSTGAGATRTASAASSGEPLNNGKAVEACINTFSAMVHNGTLETAAGAIESQVREDFLSFREIGKFLGRYFASGPLINRNNLTGHYTCDEYGHFRC